MLCMEYSSRVPSVLSPARTTCAANRAYNVLHGCKISTMANISSTELQKRLWVRGGSKLQLAIRKVLYNQPVVILS